MYIQTWDLHDKNNSVAPLSAQVARILPFSNVDGPGNRMVFFLQGCNYRCQVCHNPQTIARNGDHSERLTVTEALQKIRRQRHFIRGITLSGGEASLQAPFVVALCRAVRTDPELSHLTCLLDTNGSLPGSHWSALLPWLEGAMVDLKAWDDARHRVLTGHGNLRVKRTLDLLARQGKLAEVRLLLVPEQSDYLAAMPQLIEFLQHLQQQQSALGSPFSLRLNGFNPHGVEGIARTWPAASREHVLAVAEPLRQAGLGDVRLPAIMPTALPPEDQTKPLSV